MSNIRAIASALAALTVSYTAEAGGTVTPTAYDVQQLPPTVAAANLPVRLIGTQRGDSSASLNAITAGTGSTRVDHSISELALIELVGLSRMQDEWCDTMRYMDALTVALQAARAIYARSEITGASASRSVFEYPNGSGEYFYGCQTIVNITEYQ